MDNINVNREVFKSWIKKALDQLPMFSNICFIIGMYIVLKYDMYDYWWQKFVVLSVYFILIMATQSFDRWNRKQKQIGTIPTRKKRFTIKLDEATVVKKSDMEEAILYLSDIEDYLGK